MKDLSAQLTRQSDLIPEKVLRVPIAIVGCGAIGSWTTLLLAKMGLQNLIVFDYDDVEIENINSQFFSMADIGHPKIVALTRKIYEFTTIPITGYDEKFDFIPNDVKIVISAVDSMMSRQEIYKICKESKRSLFLIDPRMAIETALVYTCDLKNKKQRENYENSLYNDGQAVQERCTAKSTAYTANLIAGQITKIVKDYITNSPYIKTLQWDIAKNIMLSFPSEVREVASEVKEIPNEQTRPLVAVLQEEDTP